MLQRTGAGLDAAGAPYAPYAPLPPTAVVETASGPLRYAQAGVGPDVVLIHGAMASLEDMLLGPFEPLAQSWRVTAFDRPGHGTTPRRRLRGSIRDQAAHIREGVAALGLDRPVMVGHSFGAAVVLTSALEWPCELAGAVAISPLAFPEVRLEHLLFGPRAIVGVGDAIAFGPGQAMDAAIAPVLWEAMFRPQTMPARYRALYPFELASGASQLLALGEESALAFPDLSLAASLYSRCEVPVAVLAGRADVVASPRRHARRLAGLLPKGTLTLLPGLGHMLHHFAPGAVLDAVRRVESEGAPAGKV